MRTDPERSLTLERSLALERSADALGEEKTFVYKSFFSPKPPLFQKTLLASQLYLKASAPLIRYIRRKNSTVQICTMLYFSVIKKSEIYAGLCCIIRELSTGAVTIALTAKPVKFFGKREGSGERGEPFLQKRFPLSPVSSLLYRDNIVIHGLAAVNEGHFDVFAELVL